MRRPARSWVAPTSLALLLVAAAPASSTTVAVLSFDDLVEDAARVLHGTCLESRAEWGPSGRLQTRVTFSAHRTLKGPDEARFEMVLPGGVRDGKALIIHGVPRFEVGEEVVLFATAKHPRSGISLPVGLAQGLFRVGRTPAGQAVARRDTRGLHLVDVTGGRTRPVPGRKEALPLQDLLEQVAAKVAAHRQRREAR